MFIRVSKEEGKKGSFMREPLERAREIKSKISESVKKKVQESAHNE